MQGTQYLPLILMVAWESSMHAWKLKPCPHKSKSKMNGVNQGWKAKKNIIFMNKSKIYTLCVYVTNVVNFSKLNFRRRKNFIHISIYNNMSSSIKSKYLKNLPFLVFTHVEFLKFRSWLSNLQRKGKHILQLCNK